MFYPMVIILHINIHDQQSFAKKTVYLQGHSVQPFNLSLHPFAMLTAPQAARHALKHCKYVVNNRYGVVLKGYRGNMLKINIKKNDNALCQGVKISGSALLAGPKPHSPPVGAARPASYPAFSSAPTSPPAPVWY